MAENTKIEWAHHTFNPWMGCAAVSAACANCYAESHVNRFGDFSRRVRTSAANWRKPLAWNRKSYADGKRHRVFCASLADVFDNKVPQTWRDDFFALITATPHLDWMLLTKRPQNIRDFLPADWRQNDHPTGYPNVWLGVTVENQTEAARRIPALLDIGAEVNFISCEPLLSHLDLSPWFWGISEPCEDCPRDIDCVCGLLTRRDNDEPFISLVIAGGESGHRARPSHPDWFRGLRDQCTAAGTAFFFKQWGNCLPGDMSGESETGGAAYILEDAQCGVDIDTLGKGRWLRAHGCDFIRFTHKKTGRMLDGRTWDEMPTRIPTESRTCEARKC